MINTKNVSLLIYCKDIIRIIIKLIKDILRLICSEGVMVTLNAVVNGIEGNFYKWFKNPKQIKLRRVKNPLEVVYLPVAVISKRISAGVTRKYRFKYGYKFHPKYKGLKRINPKNQGVVLGGDWDCCSENVKISSTYVASNQRFKEGKRWKDTDYYDCFLKSIYASKKKRVKGIKNWDKFRQEWLLAKDRLYCDIKNNGYKSQSQIKGGNAEDEVEVGVSRTGKVLLVDGIHRLSIAKILGIKEIPVIVKVWHKNYIAKVTKKTGLNLEKITPSIAIDVENYNNL